MDRVLTREASCAITANASSYPASWEVHAPIGTDRVGIVFTAVAQDFVFDSDGVCTIDDVALVVDGKKRLGHHIAPLNLEDGDTLNLTYTLGSLGA